MVSFKQKFPFNKSNDLGLGEKSSPNSDRALRKDGSFNVIKKGIPFFEKFNFYHTLITISWTKFFLSILIFFIVTNLIFGYLYVCIGTEHFVGIEGKTYLEKFMDAFFFSTQTLTTLGYGRIAPVGLAASTIAAIESMLGLLAFAFATGLLYGRFSRPVSKIKYSANAIISPYKEINALMFRVINPRDNQLIEVEVSVTLSMKSAHNSALREFYSLTLERTKINFFPMTWTIVHPIDETSPLWKMNESETLKSDVELIVLMKAFDEVFSQTVYSRSSYKAKEIKWGEKFVYIISSNEDGITEVDASKLDLTEKVSLKFIPE